MWQKLLYICNNFLYYNNLNITFLNYYTIEKSPLKGLDLFANLQLGRPGQEWTSRLALSENKNYIWAVAGG